MASALRTKTAVLVAAAVASTLLLTACQGSDSDDAASDTGAKDAGSSAPAAPSASAPAEQDAPSATPAASDGGSTSGSGSGGGSTSGGSATSGGDTASDEPETVIEGIDQGKGVNGTWNGKVRFLAPGKYTVVRPDGVEQQFFVSEDTDIEGTGDICGVEGGQAAMPCSEEMLEAATKGDGVAAEVVVANGIAKSIVDNR
ncbi:hypothetical protein [Streptomyces sp. AM 2-1-1]|uniref:hypothetical protein n=1 Tax=unclassified Streptomyces TaxID=2593676 RepID=UPI0023B88722|nr:hypothetical protein [Streptomyces sp. AM 2-1-1]WEH40644.1 hypothetical protein PZB77_14665 [Streptomyces sp. AM 2-1-1]